MRLQGPWLPPVVLALAGIAGCSSSDEPKPQPEPGHKAATGGKLEPARCGAISRLHTLGGVFLASQPAPGDFAEAKKCGVKTVVNLRPAAEMKDFDEKKAVEAEGLRYINLPFGNPAELTDAVFDSARELFKNSERPLLVHCASASRVGAVWLPYRVLDAGLTWDEALAEAKTVGLKSADYEKRAREYIERRAR
jgi:uncharacterized protein (TIGR01244 family)